MVRKIVNDTGRLQNQVPPLNHSKDELINSRVRLNFPSSTSITMFLPTPHNYSSPTHLLTYKASCLFMQNIEGVIIYNAESKNSKKYYIKFNLNPDNILLSIFSQFNYKQKILYIFFILLKKCHKILIFDTERGTSNVPAFLLRHQGIIFATIRSYMHSDNLIMSYLFITASN